MQDYIAVGGPPKSPDSTGTKKASKQTKTTAAGIETGISCKIGYGDGAMAICLFAHVIHQSTFRTEKIEARVDYCTAICLASRPVHFARPGLKYSILS